MNSTIASFLSNENLENFLEETENLANQLYDYDDDEENSVSSLEKLHKPSHDAIRSLLRQRLHNYQYQIDDLYTMRRLFRLFLASGDKAYAKSFIHEYEAKLLANTSADEKYNATIGLKVLQAEAQDYDLVSLQAICKAIKSRPPSEQDSYDWQRLADYAKEQQAYELERECYENMEQINQLHKNSDEYEIAQANLALQKALTWYAQTNLEKSREQVDKAWRLLQSLYQQQKIDRNEWLNFAERILAIDNQKLDEIIAFTYQHLAQDLSPPLRRSFDVKVARLKAVAYHKQGKLSQAIDYAKQGYFALTDDYDEPEIAIQLTTWLHEAGHTSALIDILYERFGRNIDEEQSEAIFQLTQKLINDGVCHTKLALILANAGHDHDIEGLNNNSIQQGNLLRGSEPADTWYFRHLELARQWAKTDVSLQGLVDVELALYDYYRINTSDKYQKVLDRLERAVKDCPNQIFADVIEVLLISRMHVLGVESALVADFIPTTGALACYSVGAGFEDSVLPYVKDIDGWTEAHENAFKQSYYENGLKQYEYFFSTGQGYYRSADVHTYSMLCNNLAIIYLYNDEYDKAIALHKKGIAASPFAEHYDGLTNNFWYMDNFFAYITAVEDLWFFARQYGYSRFNLGFILTRLAWAYNKEERHIEIATWLPRLEEWWQEKKDYLDEEDYDSEYDSYLDGLACALGHMAYESSLQQDALIRLETILTNLHERKLIFGLRHAGLCYEYLGEYDKAMQFYQEVLSIANPEKEFDSGQIEVTRDWIADLQEKMQPETTKNKKSWWKFW